MTKIFFSIFIHLLLVLLSKGESLSSKDIFWTDDELDVEDYDWTIHELLEAEI